MAEEYRIERALRKIPGVDGPDFEGEPNSFIWLESASTRASLPSFLDSA